MSFWKSIRQEVTLSEGNSSTSNLVADGIFIGIPESTLGVSAVQIMLKSDQDCIVYVDQAPDLNLYDGVGTGATNNSTTLTGTGTFFTRDLEVGDTIIFDPSGTNQTKIITSIISDTSLTVDSAFTGGSLSGEAWKHYPWDVSDTYNFNARKHQMGFTVQAVGAYVRIRVKNRSTTTATSQFRLSTVLCPIVEALPRSLDENGYLKSAIYELNDEFGNKARFSPIGTIEVDQPYRLVGTSFGSSIDTAFWTATNNGTNSASSVSSGFATLTSGISNNGFGNIQTVRSARYILGHPHRFRALVRITALSITNNTRRWGAYTTTGTPPTSVDGFYFELDGNNNLSVNYRNNGGTVVSVSSGSFNGNINSYVVDTNVHTYEIDFSLNDVQFYIDRVLIHTFTPTNTLMAATCNLNASFTSVNSAGGTASGTMEVWSGTILRLGREESAPRPVYYNGAVTAQIAKSGAGRLHRIIYSTTSNNSTITIYDALSATNTVMVLQIQGTTILGPGTIDAKLDFYTGCTITTTGANTNVTLIVE